MLQIISSQTHSKYEHQICTPRTTKQQFDALQSVPAERFKSWLGHSYGAYIIDTVQDFLIA